MQFKNVTNPLIICGNDTDKVIDLIAPPEFHITIGVTNHLLNSLEEYSPLGKALVHSWIGKTEARVHRSEYFGHSLEGPQCKKLLNNIDKLRRLAESKQAFFAFPFIDAFDAFNEIRKACFGQELQSGFEQKIDVFEATIKAVGVSITNKIHCIYDHVIPFCNKHGRGLGFFLEQAAESAHRDFNAFMNTHGYYRHTITEDQG